MSPCLANDCGRFPRPLCKVMVSYAVGILVATSDVPFEKWLVLRDHDTNRTLRWRYSGIWKEPTSEGFSQRITPGQLHRKRDHRRRPNSQRMKARKLSRARACLRSERASYASPHSEFPHVRSQSSQ
jgi:hypothetical protein